MNDYLQIKAKKSLGQHFLTSAVVPNWMCDAADIQHGDVVVEVGPGTGVLTKEILKRGATVVALETDIRAIETLGEMFKDEIAKGNLILHHTDVRTLSLLSLTEITQYKYKVVANIPYYLSGFLFRLFLESSVQPTTLVYLVQKEVAKRITTSISTGQKESLLSLSVKAYGAPTYVRTVTRGHFTPQPKVDSAIIAITNITKEHFKDIEESTFFEILNLGFGQKRKQLLGNLSKKYDRQRLAHIFSTAGVSTSVRAEDVPLEKWFTLVSLLSKHS